MEQQWNRISEALVEAVGKVVQTKERTMRREGMTEEILRKMEIRKKNKRNTSTYRRLYNEIRIECDQAMERWLDEKCDKIELLSAVGKTLINSRIKELKGSPRNKSGTVIKKRDGEIAVGMDEVKKR